MDHGALFALQSLLPTFCSCGLVVLQGGLFFGIQDGSVGPVWAADAALSQVGWLSMVELKSVPGIAAEYHADCS
jgi:hypothetical protein